MTESATTWVYWNGELVPADEARVSVFDAGFLYGDGIYETMRCYAGKPFVFSRHADRLQRSGAGIALQVPAAPAIRHAIDEVITANAIPEAVVRVTVTRGCLTRRLDLSSAGTPTFLVTAEAVAAGFDEEVRRGIDVVYSRWLRLSDHPLAGVKSTNYQVSLFARNEAREAGAREVLIPNESGQIAEAAAANVFLVADGNLVTPPVRSGILPGITRELVLELAAARGISCREETFSRERIASADELFLSATSLRVAPVVRVDGEPVGDGQPGPIALALLDDYRGLVHRETGSGERVR